MNLTAKLIALNSAFTVDSVSFFPHLAADVLEVVTYLKISSCNCSNHERKLLKRCKALLELLPTQSFNTEELRILRNRKLDILEIIVFLNKVKFKRKYTDHKKRSYIDPRGGKRINIPWRPIINY